MQGVTLFKRIMDKAAAQKRIGDVRGLYVTESGFLTGATIGNVVTPEQQALFQNQTEAALAEDSRIRAVSQLQLVDAGDGAWETGLRWAFGDVTKNDGAVVSGDLLEVVRGSHVVVRPSAGVAQTIGWGDVRSVVRTQAGSEKPALGAYRIAVSAYREAGGKLTVLGHARPDTGAGFSIEGYYPTPEGSGDWLEIKVVATDVLGYGRATIDVGGATAWRLRFASDVSRTTSGNDPKPDASIVSPINGSDGVIGADLFGVNSMGKAADLGGLTSTSTGAKVPGQTFGAIRWWDDSMSLGTLWCEMQPTADADVEKNLRARLDPKLDAAAAAGVKRIVMVVGHPAPWVYGGGSQVAPPGLAPWYCGRELSAVSLPSADYLADQKGAPKQGWLLFGAYVEKLLTHVNAKYGGKLPFEIDLQTWNEPTADSLNLASGVPQTAQSAREAFASLVRYDTIVRYYLDNLPGLDHARFKLLLSPLTLYNDGSRAHEYLVQAAASHAAGRYTHYKGVYDGLSVQTYSEQQSKPPRQLSVAELLEEYETGRLPRILGGIQKFRALRALPVFQTETNHAFAVDDAHRALNKLYSTEERRTLMARLMLAPLQFDLAGQFLYTLSADNYQYPLFLEPTDSGTVKNDDASLQALITVRGWIVGRRLDGCSNEPTVWDCVLRPPPFTAEEHIVFSKSKGSTSWVVPKGLTTKTLVDGSPATTVTAGATETVGLAPVLFR